MITKTNPVYTSSRVTSAIQAGCLDDILLERIRQTEKHGIDKHDQGTWLVKIVEEVGEVSKSIIEKSNYEEELIHVAATALAALEDWRKSQNQLYEESDEYDGTKEQTDDEVIVLERRPLTGTATSESN